MRKYNHIFFSKFLLLCITLAFMALQGCKEEVDTRAECVPIVDPSNPNQLSQYINIGNGTLTTGTFPTTGTGSNCTLYISGTPSAINASNGSTPILPFTYNGAQGGIRKIYLQIVGANKYFVINVSNSTTSSGTISLDMTLPVSLIAGNFTATFRTEDANGCLSNIQTTQVQVLHLGVGSLQVNLTWDSETDTDLHVIDANGEEIYFLHSTSASGGQLDHDDISGYGPENVFWEDTAPDGDYTVKVHLYSGSLSNFRITINATGVQKMFTGTVTSTNKWADVCTFHKNGTQITF